MKRLGIVIPTYNEDEKIESLEKNLKEFEDLCDIVFSDGFSTDKTFEKITYKKIRRTKFRSNQMNEGVKELNNELILFLHADSIIKREAILELLNTKEKFGCFRIKFFPSSPFMKYMEITSNLRVILRHIAFGDQGIFIDRELFLEIGGFKSLKLMEDYELSMTLKEKKIYPTLLKSEITTSSRRFLKNGMIRTALRMQKYQRMYRKAKRSGDIYEEAEKIARLYNR